MNLSGNAMKLKIIVSEGDQVYQRPLYEAIVFAAKKYKLSGATVTKGILNYGANSIAQSIKVFALASELPIIIELVDYKERLIDFAVIIEKLMDKAQSGGLITMEEVSVLRYGHKNSQTD
jgi:uncharacterized protein